MITEEHTCECGKIYTVRKCAGVVVYGEQSCSRDCLIRRFIKEDPDTCDLIMEYMGTKRRMEYKLENLYLCVRGCELNYDEVYESIRREGLEV